MLQNWFIFLPELCLLGFFPIAWTIEKWRSENTSKTFFTLAQIFLAAAFVSNIIFYNKSAFPHLWLNTTFSTWCKTLTYVLAWVWFYLSSKWFLNKNRSSYKFYKLSMLLLLALSSLVSAASLISFGLTVFCLCIIYYRLILYHWDTERMTQLAHRFAGYAFVFCLLLGMGIFHLYQTTHTFEYSQIGNVLATGTADSSPWIKIDILLLISGFLFLLALVPFHNWFIALEANTVLPVCGVFTLIPPLVYICALFNLVRGAFQPYTDFIRPLLGIFAAISLIIGSLSANKEPNIRRLLACVAISCFGCAVLCLSDFSQTAVMASFAYMVSAEIALVGIYTVLLGFKSKGEYLHELSALSGFYQVRPYLAALLLIFIFSLTGLAPTLGFFGNVSVLSNFITHHAAWQISLILLSQLLLISAFLPVIQALYFNPLQDKFDRTDKAVYLCLGFNLALMITALLTPSGLLNDALLIMKGIF